MSCIKFLIFLVVVALAHAQDDDEGDYDGDAGAAQPAGWGDGFFGGDGGDDEGFAAASGQATAGDQAPEVVGGSESGSGLFGQEAGGLGGLYGALGVGSNPKPVVKAAPKRK